MLRPAEIRAFVEDGYVAVRGALPREAAEACQDSVWSELREHGVARDDPATWMSPVIRIISPRTGPFAAAGPGSVPVLREACDQLIGEGRWWRRTDVGGTIPVRFPGPDDPGDAGWHIEASFRPDDQDPAGRWRVNFASRGRGLLALYLLTDVGPDDAPTRLRPGSHLDVAAVLAPAGDEGMDATAAGVLAAEASAGRPVALASGRAGDVLFCHPFLVHAATWPHCGPTPRMIAQPPVTMAGQFPLGANGPLSPVEQAIAAGLAAARAS